MSISYSTWIYSFQNFLFRVVDILALIWMQGGGSDPDVMNLLVLWW